MIKDYAPRLRTKQSAKEREEKVMEVFSWIGIGTVAYITLKVAGWVINLIWWVMEWGIYQNV